MRVLIAAGQRMAERAQALVALAPAAGLTVSVVQAQPRAAVPFRKVVARLIDPRHERDVAIAIRALEPDLVHVLGCAGGTSVDLAWIARSLGVPCTLEVEAATLLCHRGDLVHGSGEPCRITDDPLRCAACCLTRTPGRGGLSAAGAVLARATSCLGDLALRATPLALRNRLDMVAGALADADAVVVADEAARHALSQLVPRERLHLLAPPATTALVQLWRQVA